MIHIAVMGSQSSATVMAGRGAVLVALVALLLVVPKPPNLLDGALMAVVEMVSPLAPPPTLVSAAAPGAKSRNALLPSRPWSCMILLSSSACKVSRTTQSANPCCFVARPARLCSAGLGELPLGPFGRGHHNVPQDGHDAAAAAHAAGQCACARISAGLVPRCAPQSTNAPLRHEQLRSGGNMSFEDIYDQQPWITLHPAYRGPAELVEQAFWPRVFKNHNRLMEIQGEGKQIVTLRDPAKTARSQFEFYREKGLPPMRANGLLWTVATDLVGLAPETSATLFGDAWKTFGSF